MVHVLCLLRTQNPKIERLLAHSVASYPEGFCDLDCNWLQAVSGGCEHMRPYRGNILNPALPFPSTVRSVHVAVYTMLDS